MEYAGSIDDRPHQSDAQPTTSTKGASRMRRIMLSGVAAMAMLALAVVTAASAAAAAPEFVPAKGALTIKSGTGKLNIIGSSNGITCKKDKGTGSITGAKTASSTIDFEECSTLSGLIKCNSLGDSSGIILVPGVSDLVLNTGGTIVLNDFLITGELHVECTSAVLLLIKGDLLCPITPTQKKVKTTEHFTISCKEKESGVNEFTEAKNEKGETKKLILETSENGGAYKQSGEETTEEVSSTEEGEITG
jgi:hypothetical protein